MRHGKAREMGLGPADGRAAVRVQRREHCTMPTGPDWLHEVKYDGYRMMVIRDRDRVRLISNGGHDWARNFPLIIEAALKLRQRHFVR
jgi:ATP-dependent DNA ligase